MYFLGKKYDKKSDVDQIKRDVQEIENNLEALGFTVRVVEANINQAFYEYYLEVAMGTDLNKLEKHDRTLALALKSPTGKVYWQIPMPGKNYLGIDYRTQFVTRLNETGMGKDSFKKWSSKARPSRNKLQSQRSVR